MRDQQKLTEVNVFPIVTEEDKLTICHGNFACITLITSGKENFDSKTSITFPECKIDTTWNGYSVIPYTRQKNLKQLSGQIVMVRIQERRTGTMQ
jgi:hypothetical protein